MSLSFDTLASILLLITLLIGGMGVVAHALRIAPRAAAPWIWLMAGVVAAAAWLRLVWVPPHHAMYVDEPWYLEAARNLLRHGALVLCQRSGDDVLCAPYPKAAGWPVVLAGAFALFGSGSGVAFALSAFLSTAAVWWAAVVVRLAGGAWQQAAFAALLVGVHPLHVAWSATAETNSASTAILLAGVAGVLWIRRRTSLAGAALAAGGLGLAAAMRPELAMALVPVLAVLMIARAGASWLGVAIIAGGGALGATSVVASWPLYIANSSGTFLSPNNLGPNFTRLLATEEGGPLTLLILVLSIAGAIGSLRRRAFAVVAILGGGGLLTALVAIGYDRRIFYTRTVLGSLVLLAPLAALALPGNRRLPSALEGSASALPGIAKQCPPPVMQRTIAAAAFLLAVALAIPGLRHVARVPDTQLLETRLPAAVADAVLPVDAIVIAQWPTVLAAETDVIAVAADNIAADDTAAFDALAVAIERRPHLLLCDMFCEPGFGGGTAPPTCARILTQFEAEEVTAVFDHRRRYGLYRLVRRAGPGGATPPCPFPLPE